MTRLDGSNEWVQASIKNLLVRNPKFSPAIIDHILKLVRPQTEEAQRCKQKIIFAATLIAELPDYVSPTVERRLLQEIVAKLEAAQAAIVALPWWSGGQLQRLTGPVITETTNRAAKLADRITARSGKGSPKKHTLAQQKQIAAEKAIDILRGRKLTTMSDGIYCRVASSLFELGTGRALSERALEKACAKALSQAKESS
jgi:hypothetical protein